MENSKIIRGGGYDYLSLPNTNCIKGIFALFVLIHHLYQYSGLFHKTYVGGVLQGLGYLSVAMFFFLSGYGLQISYAIKGISYVKSIPGKRVLPLYAQCLVLIAIYSILYVVVGKEIPRIYILKSLTWGGTVISGGWYLQAIMVLYLLYFLAFGVIGGSRKKSFICLFTTVVLYALLNAFLGMTVTWYQSIFAFLLGIVWCDNKEKIDSFLSKRWLFITFVAFVAFAILFVVGLKIKVVTILSAVAFVILGMLLLMKLPVNCAVTRWLGKYYFEIYVMQGIALQLFHSEIVYIENGWLYVMVCTGLTLALAVVSHPILAAVSRRVRGKK